MLAGVLTVPLAARADEPAPDAAPTERRSTPLLVTGLALSGVGVAGIGVGATLLGSADARCEQLTRESNRLAVPLWNPCAATDGQAYIGVVTMVVGGVFMLTGVPLAIAGGTSVPRRTASAAPEVLIGNRAAALRWTF